MRAVNYTLACRDFVNGINKDRTFALKLLDHKAVVDNLFADVDRRTKGLERNTDNINRAHDAGAESARLQQKQCFRAFRHYCFLYFKYLKNTLFPVPGCKKATEKNRLGQRKCKNCEELAARGEKAGLNGGGLRVGCFFFSFAGCIGTN